MACAVRGFALVFISTFSLLAGEPASRGQIPTPAIKDFHYELAMSVDDALCRPLNTLYNKLFKQLLGQGRRAQHETDFVSWEAGKFRQIGLVSPTPLGSHSNEPFEAAYSVDLFGNGRRYILELHDLYRGRDRYTEVKFHEPGSSVESDGGPPSLIESQRSYQDLARGYYLLSKWPGFEKIFARKIAGDQTASIPLIEYIPIIRVFLKGKMPYFILSEYFALPPHYSHESVVVVYKLIPGGHEDICYLALAPTQFTDLMKKQAHE